jgi:NADH:ubiquinone oxidoreductase subunit C
METEVLKTYFSALEPLATFEEGGEWLMVHVSAENWKNIASKLITERDFDFLFCVTCVDFKTHLTMVYHLRSMQTDETVVIKIQLDRDQPVVATVSDIWRTAEFHEREAFEMFGVQFTGHPDLRKLILPDDFEGFPMRKDFEDPINMIKL